MCPQDKQNRNHIKITVNKAELVLPEGVTVAELLEMRDVKAGSSVWVNGSQLLLSEYSTRVLQEGDTVKILRVVAGG